MNPVFVGIVFENASTSNWDVEFLVFQQGIKFSNIFLTGALNLMILLMEEIGMYKTF